MNCQTFESHINDLARERVMEATLRAAADAHASTCARCAARLADERTLSAGLRSLAATARECEAPSHLEAALLSAFRAHQQQASSAHTATPFAQPTGKRRARRMWVAAAAAGAAVAATVLLSFGLSGTSWREAGQPAGQPPAQAAASPSFGAVPIGRHPGEISAGIGSHALELETGEAQSSQSPAPAPRATASAVRQPAPPRIRPASLSHQADARAAAAAQPAADSADEIATDFIPLTRGNNLAAEDGGQVMRVELPRSALVSFGLPMNVERAGERIKADVLVGDDGVARAIRFVR